MGESEAVTPAEEVGTSNAARVIAEAAEDAISDANGDVGDIARSNGPAMPRSDSGANPWPALVQVGVQFVAALAAANDPEAAAHPWIELDPATGARSLKMPLPPPETVRQLADALSALAGALRDGASR
jgi:hypothetical protein